MSNNSISIHKEEEEPPTSSTTTQIDTTLPRLSLTLLKPPSQFSSPPRSSRSSTPAPKSKFPFSLLPPELRLQIYSHLLSPPLTPSPPPTIRIKFRFPSHSTTLSCTPAPFILLPTIPSLQHVNHELREEFEKIVPGLGLTPKERRVADVFDDQGYSDDLPRRLFFTRLSSVRKFCAAFPHASYLTDMRISMIAVRLSPETSLRDASTARVLGRMVRLFGGLERVLVIVKSGADGRGRGALWNVWRDLEGGDGLGWVLEEEFGRRVRRGVGEGDGREGEGEEQVGRRGGVSGERDCKIPEVCVISTRDMKIRCGKWTVVSVK